jgi:alkylated DNA repair dioxygenase AlkB
MKSITRQMNDSLKNDRIVNFLPYDGTVIYHGKAIPEADTHYYFKRLFQTIEWKNDEVVIFGKHIVTKRKTAWYGDTNFLYAYSNLTKEALIWTTELIELKDICEKLSGCSYNSCLLNLYHNGEEGMGWHSDDEKSLKANAAIASLSLGPDRKFSFRHKSTKETVSLLLENGSLLLMKDTTQTNWQHSLPKSRAVVLPRINLTFRTMACRQP